MPRGKKTCRECNTELGVRTGICPQCGFDFSSLKKEIKSKIEEKKNGDKNGKSESISPIVADLLEYEEGHPYVEPKKLTSDENADRILSYGKNRANSLLGLSKNGGWKHVNWSRVKEKIGALPDEDAPHVTGDDFDEYGDESQELFAL